MAKIEFITKVWKERKSDFPNRRQLALVDEEENIYNVLRAEGTVAQEGDQWSPETMEELEGRISSAVTGLDDKIDDSSKTLNTRINNVSATLNNTITNTKNELNARINNEVSLLNTKIDNEIYALNTRITNEVSTLNARISNTTNTLTTQMKQKTYTRTLARNGWIAYIQNGETMYQQTVSPAIPLTLENRADFYATPYYESKLFSPVGWNGNIGDLVAATAVLPNIDIPVSIVVVQRRF